MNPRTIFSAVAAVCFMMIMVLPRLAVSSRASEPLDAQALIAEASVAAASVSAGPGINILSAQMLATPVPAEALAVAEAAAAGVVAETLPEAEVLPAATLAPFDIPIQEPPASPPPVERVEPVTPPDLQSFADSVTNGDAGTVTGVYAEGIFALAVRQQPAEDLNYISNEYDTATQYARPTQFGVTALLAHNTLSGRLFFNLRKGSELTLVYGDGRLARFRIRDLQNYQALSPYDTRSDFVDLNNPGGTILSHTDLYQRVYTTANTLVLQTCIEANGETTWGRLFVIADPI